MTLSDWGVQQWIYIAHLLPQLHVCSSWQVTYYSTTSHKFASFLCLHRSYLHEAPRVTTCELECDAVAADILNRTHESTEEQFSRNPGISALWQDERNRRQSLHDLEELKCSLDTQSPGWWMPVIPIVVVYSSIHLLYRFTIHSQQIL